MDASQSVLNSRTTKAPTTNVPSTPSVSATPSAVEKAENPWALLREGRDMGRCEGNGYLDVKVAQAPCPSAAR